MNGMDDFKQKVKEMADKARAKAQAERKPGQSDIDRLKERLSQRADEFRHRGSGRSRGSR